jgi:hypothetical protein
LWYFNGTLNGTVSDGSPSGLDEDVHAPFLPVVGQWYHLAYTYDNSIDLQSLYVNGVLIGSKTQTNSIAYDTHPVILGGQINFGTPSGFLPGKIDELSIYSVALNASQLQGIFNAGSMGKRQDLVPPAITCPTNRTAQCDTFTNLALMGIATAVDNCDPNPTVTFTDSIVGSPCSATMVVTRTWKATDCAGNMTTCAQTITVNVPGSAPPVVTCPTNITVQCGSDTSPAGTGTAAAAVVCGSLTITNNDVEVAGTNCSVDHIVRRITRTWIAIDQCGNTNTCAQVITVRDTNAPIITCPTNLTVQCFSEALTDFAGGSATDSCGTPMVTHVKDVTQTNNCVITITRTYQASDGCGNTNACTQVITVRDTTPPILTCPTNITVECNTSTAPGVTGNATATDNCDTAPIISFVDTEVAGTCPIVRVITRKWAASDHCGNTNTCVQTITVQATLPPIITCPTNITVQCSGSTATNATGTATATSCGPAPVITHTDTETAGTCPFNKVITRTWTVTDSCGNSNSCVQVITVADTTPPALACPQNITTTCNGSLDPAVVGSATATDNCDNAPILNFIDSVIGGPCPNPRTITRTWIATDRCGNTATCQQIISATDACLCGPAPTNALAWWKGEGNANDSIDSHGGTLQNGVTFATGVVGQAFSFDGANDYITVTDAATLHPVNLSIEGWFNFTATNSLRTMVSKSVGNNARNSFMLWLEDGVLRGQVDNNGGGTTIVSYSGFSPVPGQWYHIAYTFQDSANLQALYVDGALVASGATSETISYDNGALLLGADSNNGTPAAFFSGRMDEVAIYSRALSTSEIQDIFSAGSMGKDATPPTLTCPPNLMTACDSWTNLAVTGRATATDACDPHPSVIFSDSIVGGICQTSMVVTRTWRATDCHGNVATCAQIITVKVASGTTPMLVCPPNATVECGNDASPEVTGMATAIALCGTVTVTNTDTVTPGTHCATDHIVRTISRRWTATDLCGNSTNCLQLITVRDTTAPLITCPDDIVTSTDPGECTAKVNFTVPVTDACDANPSVICVPASNTALPIGLTTVFCTGSDACGNISMCSFTVTVEELDPSPELTIRHVGTNVVICWPAGCPDYQLESKPVLNPATPWVNVQPPPTLSGDRFCVTLGIGNTNLFFRLRRL